MVIKFILYYYSRIHVFLMIIICNFFFLLPKIKDEKGDLSDKKSKLNHEGN